MERRTEPVVLERRRIVLTDYQRFCAVGKFCLVLGTLDLKARNPPPEVFVVCICRRCGGRRTLPFLFLSPTGFRLCGGGVCMFPRDRSEKMWLPTSEVLDSWAASKRVLGECEEFEDLVCSCRDRFFPSRPKPFFLLLFINRCCTAEPWSVPSLYDDLRPPCSPHLFRFSCCPLLG